MTLDQIVLVLLCSSVGLWLMLILFYLVWTKIIRPKHQSTISDGNLSQICEQNCHNHIRNEAFAKKIIDKEPSSLLNVD